MLARLVIDESGYRLLRRGDQDWIELAVLQGGASALLLRNRPVDQRTLEAAIDRAENWLMPHAARISGAHLEVIDATGRLASGLREVLATEDRHWTIEQFETLFLDIDFMSARPHLAVKFQGREHVLADIVLLRELAHHAKLREIRLTDSAGDGEFRSA